MQTSHRQVPPPRIRLGRTRAILRRLPQGPVLGVEVGVYRGELSAELLRSRPDLFLYMVDSWLPKEAQPEGYRATRDSHALMTVEQQERNRTLATEATEFAKARRMIIRMPSTRAASDMIALKPPPNPDSMIHWMDFVFLDGDHSFDGVRNDIVAWRHMIKPGGLLCGHDYCPGYGPDKQYDFKVIDAVDAAVAQYGWTLELDEDSTWFVRL